MEERLKAFIKTILDDPVRRSNLLALLEKEGFHVDDPLEEPEETQ